MVRERVFLPQFVGGAGLDLLIFGGGSIFKHIKSVQHYRSIYDAAKRANPDLEAIAVGVSIGPFQNREAEGATRDFLAILSEVMVRDERSAELLRTEFPGVAFSFAADPALAYCGSLQIA